MKIKSIGYKYSFNFPIINPVELGKRLVMARIREKIRRVWAIRKRQRLIAENKITSFCECGLCKFLKLKYENNN